MSPQLAGQGLETTQNALDHRDRDQPSFLPQQHHQLVLTTAGILLPQTQHRLCQFRAPGGLAHPLGATGAVLQAAQVPPVVAATPTVEGLGADVEVATGQAGIVIVFLNLRS
jgi:hypothetical protein